MGPGAGTDELTVVELGVDGNDATVVTELAPRRWLPLVILAAFLVAALALGVARGGSEQDADEAAPATSTTAPTSSTSTTEAPTTTRAPRTTTTLPARMEAADGWTPLPDAVVDDRIVLASDDLRTRWLLDTRTGSVERLPDAGSLSFRTGAFLSPTPLSGGGWLIRSEMTDVSALLPAAGSEPARLGALGGSATVSGDRIVQTSWRERGPLVSIVHPDTDERSVREVPQVAQPVATLDGRLVVGAYLGGGTYVEADDDGWRQVSTGAALVGDDGWAVTVRCTDDLACRMQVEDLEAGRIVGEPRLFEPDLVFGFGSIRGRSGDRLLLGGEQPLLVDRSLGFVDVDLPSDLRQRAAFSEGSTHLLSTSSGALRVVDLATGEATTHPVPVVASVLLIGADRPSDPI